MGSKMKWSDDYATGIERIDEQHKTIFRMAEDFGAALATGGGERTYEVLLDFLDRYCGVHFRFEERCMEEYRCPVAQKNREAHARFTKVLGGFRQRYAANGYLVADAYEFVETVEHWLSNHICGVDVHLKQCVRG